MSEAVWLKFSFQSNWNGLHVCLSETLWLALLQNARLNNNQSYKQATIVYSL